RIRLSSPSDLPSGRVANVSDDGSSPANHVRVVASPTSFAIFWDEDGLAIATKLSDDTIHLKVDLRAIGMDVYDDATGLHIGPMMVSSNTFAKAATAINLSR